MDATILTRLRNTLRAVRRSCSDAQERTLACWPTAYAIAVPAAVLLAVALLMLFLAAAPAAAEPLELPVRMVAAEMPADAGPPAPPEEMQLGPEFTQPPTNVDAQYPPPVYGVYQPDAVVPSPQPAPASNAIIVGPQSVVIGPAPPGYDYGYAPEPPGGSVEQRMAKWNWTILPDGLIYRPYLASTKETRLSSVMFYEKNYGWLWDISLGARVGLLRYGDNTTLRPEGWQVDVMGAAFPRLDMENQEDLTSVDFKAGIPITYGIGRWQTQFGYYHISSHLGDEYMVRNNTFDRINYVRETLFWGLSLDVTVNLRIYAETGYAFHRDGGSEPWDFTFGVDYSPINADTWRGSPFAAVYGHLREENNFGGEFVAQAGWQWRARQGQQLLRTGFQYFNGKSPQLQFFDASEEQYGIGLWYDF